MSKVNCLSLPGSPPRLHTSDWKSQLSSVVWADGSHWRLQPFGVLGVLKGHS